MSIPNWCSWDGGVTYPPECGGHSFMYHPVQLTDLRRLSERAFLRTGKFQVLHRHGHGQFCEGECEVLGGT